MRRAPAALPRIVLSLAAALVTASAVPADAPPAGTPLPGTPSAGGSPARKAVPGLTRPWEVFVVQHTHTDLGYTATQPRLLCEHLRFIDEAVALVRETDGLPEEARFRWTCEATWGVEEYLRNRPPEAIGAFLDAVRRGRIEVTGLPMNLTDLATEEVVLRGLQAVRELRALGIPIRSAMQCDTNGYPWALPRVLSGAGIRWFASASNETRSRIPFKVPTAFLWESPDGSSVLAFRGFHYHVGNHLGLATSLEEAEKKLPDALARLEKGGYPYRAILLQVSGYFTDNSPPSRIPCDVVRRWNEKYDSPRLRIATLSEWFAALEGEAAGKVDRLRIGWPDWWADGNGSAPLEVSLVREAQERLGAADVVAAVAGTGLGREGKAIRDRARAAYRSALLFDEHTWGASGSVNDPGGLATKTQWGFKSAFAFDAAAAAEPLLEASVAALAERTATGDEPRILLLNPLPWERTEVAEARIPLWALPPGGDFRIADAETGEPLPIQVLGRGQSEARVLVRAPRVPPLGYRALLIAPGPTPPAESPFRFEGTSLASDACRIEVDPRSGAIAGLRDVATGWEAAGSGSPGLNCIVFEDIPDRRGRDALWPIRTDAKVRRRTPESVKVEKGLAGPLAASLRVTGTVAGVSFSQEVILHAGEREVRILDVLRKPGNVAPESAYFAFPFRMEKPEVRAEVAGGVLRPGEDQVPGMATDWHSVQRWVRLEEGGRGLAWTTLDAPLVQFGGLNAGLYQETLPARRPAFYSWALNNYWFTNFPAVQAGEFSFRYAIRLFPGPGSDSAARRFARERAMPLIARAIPARRNGPLTAPAASALKVEPDNVTIAALKSAEDGSGAIIRIEEEDGRPTTARLSFHPGIVIAEACRTDVLEDPQDKLTLAGGGGAPVAIELPLQARGCAQVKVAPFLWARR